ncbi:MAG: response regulator [Oscillospiraceae bacterium]|nr:response regulator [Oscillospiraceae bacterium]
MAEKNKSTHKKKFDKNIVSTAFAMIIIVLCLIVAYLQIVDVLRKRSTGRMEENVTTVSNEVVEKFKRDSEILNATAEILSKADTFDIRSAQAIIAANSPLFESMRIQIIMPDETLILADGEVTNTNLYDNISYKESAPLGEHISGRVISITGQPVLRHFVPIKRDGKTAAMLYGITRLDTLSEGLNTYNNAFDGAADVYIIDSKNGDFILDTFHGELLNLHDYSSGDYEHEVRGDKTWEDCINDILSLEKGSCVFHSSQSEGWKYLYYAPAGINGWSIAVQVSENVVFANVIAVQKIWLVVGVILMIVIVLYYLWVTQNFREYTKQAVKQAVLTEKLQKAEAADRAKSMFLSNMSHDLRTPMNAIIGYTTLVQSNLDKPEKTEEYLKKILSSSNHMLSLINDVLDMSRIESGKLNIEEKECSISDIFRDMRNIIQTQMKSKQLNFFMDTIDVIDEDIYCDKLHTNQVILNLLSNAIKFTPSGGSVGLTIRQKPNAAKGFGAYEIRVKDNGMGMSEEFTKHIFEPFERERNSTISGIQGTGLGMAITKNIVDAMGGTIEVFSEKGKGTEFVINVEFRLQSEPKKIESVQVLEGLRALIADDNFATCDSVSKMLHQIGMRPDWVLHGKEAVLHAKQAYELGDEYKAYIIDWLLPDLNGLEVVRQIRAEIGDSAPIIIISAYDWADIEEEALAAGVTAFCSKPIFLSELRDVLAKAAGSDISRKDKDSAPDLSSIEGTRLLLVEDNELNREIANELLSERGFVIEQAENGQIAVDMVKQSEEGYYKIILMDVQMPVMDGYTATKEIRALENPALANIPIVAMTANAFEEDKKRAVDSGMNAHIAKPIDFEKLIEVVIDLLADNK